MRKKVYVTAGYNTLFFGPGRPEFNPKEPMPSFETYLRDAATGVMAQLKHPVFDEGVIGNFMAPRFLKQANLPGFLPSVVPSLLYKPCIGVEGACGSGGRALGVALRSLLSDLAETVFVLGFEVQNGVKAVYGADILAGAAHVNGMRKEGAAHFFPALFAERAAAYYAQYGEEKTRRAMAKWYELSILNARKNPKAQEYHNVTKDLFELALTAPDPARFIPHLNLYHCSKVTDGASALVMASEEGLEKMGIAKEQTVEVVGVGEAEGDITQFPSEKTWLATTHVAAQRALKEANLKAEDLGVLELHDCFAITALLALEALELTARGEAAEAVLMGRFSAQGELPVNPSGGLCGFGHPVGGTGVRQLVDLWEQGIGTAPHLVQKKSPYGMMISMGGNDVTVTALVVKSFRDF